MVVMAFKFAGSRAARKPHVIYQLLAWVGRFWLSFRAVIGSIFRSGTPDLPLKSGFFSTNYQRRAIVCEMLRCEANRAKSAQKFLRCQFCGQSHLPVPARAAMFAIGGQNFS